MKPKYSIIIPLKDEEHNILPLLSEIEKVMSNCNDPWEVICVDDGSTDKTLDVLKSITNRQPQIKVIVFKSNFGQSSAFAIGFKQANGEFVITIDGDGQNDPADIPKLIEAIEDCDLVCGIRQKRKDPLTKRWISKIANSLRRKITLDQVKDTGCSLKIYRSKCLKNIKMYHGMHRFLPALFMIEGYRIKEIPVNHRKRMTGKTKYSFSNRSLNTLFDLLAVGWMRKRQIKAEISEIITHKND